MGATTSSELQVEESVTNIQNCRKQVEESIAKSRGGLSSETLKAFTEGLSNVHLVVVEAILQEQRNVLNDVDLRDLVKEYFEASLDTLEFLNEVEHCLRVLEDSHTDLRIAINKCNNEEFNACVEILKKFEAKDNPFEEKFYPVFDKLHKRQEALLRKVTKMHDENEKKRKNWWANLFSIVIAAAGAVTRVCRAIAVVFPPIAVLANIHERRKNREEIIKNIFASTTCIIKMLDDIHILAKDLSNQIDSLKYSTRNHVSIPIDSYSLQETMKTVEERTENFREGISKLTLRARKCKEDIMDGRDKVAALISKFT